jgi:hypothetical protein
VCVRMAVAEAVTTDRTAWRTELYGVAHRTRNMCFVRKMTEGNEFLRFLSIALFLCLYASSMSKEVGSRDVWREATPG